MYDTSLTFLLSSMQQPPNPKKLALAPVGLFLKKKRFHRKNNVKTKQLHHENASLVLK